MPTGFSPSLTSPSRELGHGPPQRTRLETTIRQPEAGDFQVGLFPVHSPLLGESWLVSFPPLIDMLKFSGWSCLISGRMFRVSGGAPCGARPRFLPTERPVPGGRQRHAAKPPTMLAP